MKDRLLRLMTFSINNGSAMLVNAYKFKKVASSSTRTIGKFVPIIFHIISSINRTPKMIAISKYSLVGFLEGGRGSGYFPFLCSRNAITKNTRAQTVLKINVPINWITKHPSSVLKGSEVFYMRYNSNRDLLIFFLLGQVL